MWRRLRIALLLFILATVALGAWRAQNRSVQWRNTLYVTIYPINGDDRPATANYLARLDEDDFEALETWFDTEARHYGIELFRPIEVRLAAPRNSRPPTPPASGNGLSVIWWSLQMRYWAWQNDDEPGPRPDIRLFASYYDPASSPSVAHSIGLQKGLIGVANLFATRHEHGSNLVVLAHEMLHTLGATDKYDPATALPHYPDGFAEPERTPRYPQRLAEIMGGRIPLSPSIADIPRHIQLTLVGPRTAQEIGWKHEP